MIIKISNGEAIIKDIYPRKIAKEVNKILFKEVETQGDVEDKKIKQSMTGFKMAAVEEANDYALLNMIEKLTINGKETDITVEVLDEMSTQDFELIKVAIDEIAGSGDEKKK